MLTYILVIAVVVIVLYASFRALGGGTEPVAADDYRGLLGRLLGYTADRADQLDAVLLSPGPIVVVADGRKPIDPLAEAATQARKALTGYQQLLARTQTGAADDELEAMLGARSLLSAAIEDYGWACRMIEAGGYRDNSGIRDAVDGLRTHARQCLLAAGQLVVPATS